MSWLDKDFENDDPANDADMAKLLFFVLIAIVSVVVVVLSGILVCIGVMFALGLILLAIEEAHEWFIEEKRGYRARKYLERKRKKKEKLKKLAHQIN